MAANNTVINATPAQTAVMTPAQLQALYGTDLNAAANNALMSGATNATNATGANASNQVQASNQTGAFDTTGTSAQTQNQTQQNQTTGASTTNTNQQTTGQTGVVDTLGTGAMLQGQQAGATANTNAVNNFLSGVIQQGAPAFQSQVQQAVNNATSGPGMVGAGQSANARAAGYAGSEVGRQMLGQQLQAAGQLSGPTAATTLANASAPYLGQTSTQGTTGTQQQSSLENTLGTALNSLVENQSQAGTSNAGSTQIAAGTSPIQQQKGGKIICTVLVKHKLMRRETVANELVYFRKHWDFFKRSAVGYVFFAQLLAVFALHHKWFARLCAPLARACSHVILCKLWGMQPRKLAAVAYFFFFHFCDKLGWLLLRFWSPNAPDKVSNPELVALLEELDLSL